VSVEADPISKVEATLTLEQGLAVISQLKGTSGALDGVHAVILTVNGWCDKGVPKDNGTRKKRLVCKKRA
jgi:hypothetical protein